MTIIKKITTIILKRKKYTFKIHTVSMDGFHQIPWHSIKGSPISIQKKKTHFSFSQIYDILIYDIIIHSSELATIHLFLGWAPTSMCHFFHPSIHLSIHHAPYFRNHSSWDHNFWSMCKMMISLGRFSIFSKFWFFGLFVGQKMTKWPKMKRFCLSHFILREPYILWFSFMVGMCKMIISLGVFFIFLKFWFSGLLGGKRVKNCQKWQKILLLTLHVSGNIHHMIVICGTQV